MGRKDSTICMGKPFARVSLKRRFLGYLPNIVCSGQAGALPRLRGFCPEKRNLRSEFFLPIPRLPLPMTCSVKGWKEVCCGFLSHIRESFSLAVFFIESSKLGERFAALVRFFFFWTGFMLRFYSTAIWKVPAKHKNENSHCEERRSRFGWGVSPFYQNRV